MARKRGPGGVWAVGVVRAPGGVGTHWQPLNTPLNTQKMQPGVGSGEGGGVVWAVGVVRAGWGGVEGAGGCGHALAAGGVGTHWQPSL